MSEAGQTGVLAYTVETRNTIEVRRVISLRSLINNPLTFSVSSLNGYPLIFYFRKSTDR